MSAILESGTTIVYSQESRILDEECSFQRHKIGRSASEGMQEGFEKSVKRVKRSSNPFEHIEEDRTIIEKTLGGNDPSNIERFIKYFKQSFQSILDASILELAKFRNSNCNFGFGGFKIEKIKKWKIVVEFDDNQKITKLFIGRFLTKGGFTKVYITTNGNVLQVPRKDTPSSIKQLLNSYDNICFLNERNKENTIFLSILPPKPEKFMSGIRPILVAPRAVCVDKKYYKAPLNLSDVLRRIHTLIDVSTSVMISHKHGLVHGDLKPANMLISLLEERGQQHDLGGSCIFSSKDTPEEAARKYFKIVRTPEYNYFGDHEKGRKLQEEGAAVEAFIGLGCASDVFALGVSSMEILIGLADKNKVRFDSPLFKYIKKGKRSFVAIQNLSLRDIPLIKDAAPAVHENLKGLLAQTLYQDFQKRISAQEYAEGLLKIHQDLTEIGDSSSGRRTLYI